MQYLGLVEYPGYIVSDDGRIFSYWYRDHTNFFKSSMNATWRELKPVLDKRGYYRITLINRNRKLKGIQIHTLILTAFVGPRPHDMEARHFPDRNKLNNNLNNLSWGTRKENGHDRVIHGTRTIGSTVGDAVLNEAKVLDIRSRYAQGDITQKELAAIYNISRSTMSRVIRRESWFHV